MTLVTGLIGIALMVAYLGILLWWIKAPPLVVICLVVFGFVIYDFVQTLRKGENGGAS